MCTNPKKAFQIGITRNNKPSYLICDKEVHHLEKNHKGKYDKIYDWKVSPSCEGAITDFIQVPCGKCMECRLQHSKQWADRCLLEMQYHDSNLFVTLTYDDDHIPMKSDGTSEHGSLCKRDLQLFFKRLRKKYGKGISYFAAGEYGSETQRPHYHAIIFGLSLDDLVPFYTSGLGNEYYTSETLNSLWTNGMTSVSIANYENAAYTARYVMKKAEKGDLSVIYDSFCIEPEFTTMSRNPAIGLKWFNDHPYDLYSSLSVSVSTPNGGKKIFRNRYFDKRMDCIDPNMLAITKQNAIDFSTNKRLLKLAQTSLSDNELFDVESDNVESRLHTLLRKEI